MRELRSPEKFAMDYLVPLISRVSNAKGVSLGVSTNLQERGPALLLRLWHGTSFGFSRHVYKVLSEVWWEFM